MPITGKSFIDDCNDLASYLKALNIDGSNYFYCMLSQLDRFSSYWGAGMENCNCTLCSVTNRVYKLKERIRTTNLHITFRGRQE